MGVSLKWEDTHGRRQRHKNTGGCLLFQGSMT